jgi:hypothetical protein
MRQWLDQNGWQYEFVGNAISTSTSAPHQFKWGIDVHASHFGKVTDNVIYNLAGSGLQTEDGSESYNLIARNFVVKVRGIGKTLPPVPTADPDVTHNHGRDGSGFWFRGAHNWMEGNVAADVTYAGHYISRYYLVASRNVPLFPGGSERGEIEHPHIMPLLSFSRNEAYGPMEVGLYGAWVSGFEKPQTWPEIRIDRFTSWHPYYRHIDWYHNGKTTFSNLVERGDPIVSDGVTTSGTDVRTVGMRFTLYENLNLTIDHADIRGLPRGIDLPTSTGNTMTRVRNSFLQNYVNIAVMTKMTNLNVDISNVKFEPFGSGPKALNGFYNEYQMKRYPSPLNISMERDPRKVLAGTVYTVKITNFDAVSGDTFRLFDTADPAPCRTTRPGINAFTCR